MSPATTVVGIRELNDLRLKAQELRDYRAALKRIESERGRHMAVRRDPKASREDKAFSRGFFQYEHDLGKALLDEMRERGDL